ncbi:ATP-citrate synthase alpha chain protein 1 [Pyrus ussuriensis x Pyrus communis]|uniref:ATP-citrate synthase alpha chain protein 1 n=1 Tax=Pyrus ussuriensis x Pyrus communis TaxID=2448454 RepID=A0A5N5GGZ8_9ROSA|nr:ATP-citrate synthase alpha chain protein 1 [Pyrus ussuriensis x Pyrus communis]
MKKYVQVVSLPSKSLFRNFNRLDSHVWLEFYRSPSDCNIDLFGNVYPLFNHSVSWDAWVPILPVLNVDGAALNLDFAQVFDFVKERLGKEFYLNIVSDLLGNSISFSECGGSDIEENWDKTIFVPTGVAFTSEVSAPLVATLPLEVKAELEDFIKAVFALFQDLDFTFLEMNPFALVDGKPYPLDMRGELDDTAALKNFKKWGSIEFPMPFGRVMRPTEKFIHGLDERYTQKPSTFK